MSRLFLSILNMSLTAGYVILIVILIRLPLKKAPKAISYALWSVVAFRLVIPFSFESIFSLLPRNRDKALIPQDILYQQSPQLGTGAEPAASLAGRILPAPAEGDSVNLLHNFIMAGASIWIFGMAVLLIYSLVSISLLKRQLKNAKLTEKNIYEADNLKTPFVLGFLQPKIYLPVGLNMDERRYILLHEQTHINRYDHVVKLLAFLILSIHWFNPLVWIAFLLMSMDMELSCDERVLKEMNEDIKKPYAASLLSLAAGRHILNGSPLAFGEGNVKGRIKNVLNYKKPRFWVTLAAVIITVIVGTGLLTNPHGLHPGEVSDSMNEPMKQIQIEITQPDSKMLTGRVVTDKDVYKAGDMVSVAMDESVSYDVASLAAGDWIDVDYRTVRGKNSTEFVAVHVNRITGDDCPATFTLVENGKIISSNTLTNSRVACEMPSLLLSGSSESAFQIDGAPDVSRYLVIDIGALGDKIYYAFEMDGSCYAGQDHMYEITRETFDELFQYVYKNEITEDSKNIKVNLDDIEQKYNFTFEVPSNWKNKYKMIENDGYVSFVYTEYKLGDESYQEFFGIAVMTKEDYEEALEDAPMPGILLAENDNLAYVLYTPIDLAIMDSHKAEEYKQLYLSDDQIIQRFQLINR